MSVWANLASPNRYSPPMRILNFPARSSRITEPSAQGARLVSGCDRCNSRTRSRCSRAGSRCRWAGTSQHEAIPAEGAAPPQMVERALGISSVPIRRRRRELRLRWSRAQLLQRNELRCRRSRDQHPPRRPILPFAGVSPQGAAALHRIAEVSLGWPQDTPPAGGRFTHEERQGLSRAMAGAGQGPSNASPTC